MCVCARAAEMCVLCRPPCSAQTDKSKRTSERVHTIYLMNDSAVRTAPTRRLPLLTYNGV